MKYHYNLILRIFIAPIIRPEWLYYLLTWVTIIVPYIVLPVFGYSVKLIYSTPSLLVNGVEFEFIQACIATSAYYLLILLILTTKDIGFKKSIKMLLLGSFLILLMNVLRIILLMLIVLNLGENWFEIVHITFWYFVSSVYVFLVWIFLIKKFNVHNIPIYSEAKYLINQMKKRRK